MEKKEQEQIDIIESGLGKAYILSAKQMRYLKGLSFPFKQTQTSQKIKPVKQ